MFRGIINNLEKEVSVRSAFTYLTSIHINNPTSNWISFHEHTVFPFICVKKIESKLTTFKAIKKEIEKELVKEEKRKVLTILKRK
jgi:hypothetical protein